MTSTDDKAKQKAAYLARADALETIRAREIAAMTEDEALRRMWSLCTPDPVWRERRDWSGLVEQQRLFQQAMKRWRK